MSARSRPTTGSKKKKTTGTRSKTSPARKPPAKSATKPARKKAAVKKAAVKKASVKKATTKKPTRKATARKTPRKAPARKTAARKATAPSKAPARKQATTRKPAAKAPAKRTPAKQPAARKAPAKKPTTRKAPARKPAAKKAPAKKPAKKTAKKAAKKAVTKTTGKTRTKTAAKSVKQVKKTTARKAPARAKTPARKPAGSRGAAPVKAPAKKPSPKPPAKKPAAKKTQPKPAAQAVVTPKGSPSRRVGGTSKKAKRASASPEQTTATKKATTIETETPKRKPAARKSASAGKKKTARAKARARDGRQPGQAMRVPPPKTDVLITAELPDIRRAAVADERQEGHRGHLQPSASGLAQRAEDWEEPVDASLMMSALAVDVSPKIEDNYDYTVLEEFESSTWCPRPTRMVNTACGGGEAAVHFAKRGFRCVGIDSDRSQIGLARERAWLAGVDIDFMVGDLFETPNLLPAGSFGLAIDRGGFSQLEGYRERQRYLGNIRRLLFEGGIFVLSAGFFPFEAEKKAARGREKAEMRQKLLLAREGGVVVGELRQGGFELIHRVLRKTQDSGELAELILYTRKP